MEHNPFSIRRLLTNVKYRKDHPDYHIADVKIIKHEVIKFKTTDLYINETINYIKDNIIKYYQNLKSVKIYINIFTKNNIIHRFIINVSSIITDLLKIKAEINFKRTIFIFIIYENKLVYSENLDFSHLQR